MPSSIWRPIGLRGKLGVLAANDSFPLGIVHAAQKLDITWSEVRACFSMITVPIGIFYLILQRTFLESIASKGIKGEALYRGLQSCIEENRHHYHAGFFWYFISTWVSRIRFNPVSVLSWNLDRFGISDAVSTEISRVRFP